MRHVLKKGMVAAIGLVVAEVLAALPPAPGRYANCEVLSYVAAQPSGGKAPRLGASPSAGAAAEVETWVVRSSANTNQTYAVRRTRLASGGISMCAYTPNRVLATLAAGKSYATFVQEMAAKGLTVVRELMRDLDGNAVYVIEAAETENDIVEQMTMSIESTGSCTMVRPDHIYEANAVPNDTNYSDQWGLAKIGAPQAWETRTDASSVLVAVLDTGINYNHYDLNRSMWINDGEILGDGIDNDGNGYVDDIYGMASIGGNLSGNPMDDNGHGSHCAGIIGAAGNNRQWISGVAWKAKIMGLKFLNSEGRGSVSDAITCLCYAEEMGVKVVNCSFGSTDWDDYLYVQMKKMSQQGTIFVCAAGNAEPGTSPRDNDEYPFYPCNYSVDTLVSVAATDQNDALANFSYYGAQNVDIAAPGVNIYSTVLGTYGLAYKDGTSMATPHVTGALALLWAHYPGETAAGIIDRLYAAAEPIPALAGKVRTGARLSMAGFFGISASVEISVTQGSIADAVVVYWTAVNNGTHYRVWRAASEGGEKTMLCNWQQGLTYSDETAEPGVTYWYYIQAAASADGASASTYSIGVSGFRPEIDTSRITVYFNPAGGTVDPPSKVYRVGETYATLPTPTYSGKSFLGWFTAVSGGTRLDEPSIVRADATTLYARWIASDALRVERLFARQRYPWNGYVDVTFDLYGVPNDESASVTLTAREEIGGSPIALSTFIGPAPTNLVNGAQHVVWNATPDTQGILYTNMILAATVAIDEKPLLPPQNVTASNGTDPDAVAVTWSASENATSYEVWRATANNSASAALIASPTATSYSDTSAIPATNYWYWVKAVNSKKTSEFSTSVSGSRKRIATAVAITGTTSVTAGGNATYTCTATYNDNTTASVTPTWTITSGSSYASINSSTGVLTANGTATQRSVTIQASYSYNGSTQTMTKNVTINTKSVTISFNANGGTVSPTSQSYTAYGTYGSLPTPTAPTGYTFAGWFTDANGGTQVTTSSTVPASATTLWAHWTATTSMVTLDKQSGSGGTSSVTVIYDHAMPSITVPTRTGYTFGGYYTGTSGSGTQYYTASGASARNWDRTSATTTLYAKWSANTYTIRFNANGGAGEMADLTMTYDAAKNLTSNVFTRANYTFAGWATSSGGNVAYADGARINNLTATQGAVVNLYAVWENITAPLFLISNHCLTGVELRGDTDIVIPAEVKSIASFAVTNASITSIIVPNSVTNIAESAFWGCGAVTNMVLPFVGSRRGNTRTQDSVFGYIFGTTPFDGGEKRGQPYLTTGSSAYTVVYYYIPESLATVSIEDETVIADGAFGECRGIKRISLPNGVTGIGARAFQYCENMEQITIPDNVATIGNRAFSDCRRLMNIALPSRIASLSEYLFSSCDALVHITIPANVKSIEYRAFYHCEGLVEMTIPNGVTTIGDSVFCGCSSLETLSIPASVTSIEGSLFEYSGRALQSITVDSDNPCYASVNGVLYSKDMTSIICCPTSFTSFAIPSSVRNIAYGAFASCGFTSMDIPYGITNLSHLAFWCCSSLTNVTIPSSVVSIGNSAFGNCSKLTDVTIPASVTSLGAVFHWSSGLKSVKILGALSNYNIGSTGFNMYDSSSPTTYVTANWTGPTGTWQGRPVEYLTHSITFNSNGGTGTMPNQEVVWYATSNLTANAFTRSGCTFAGWATSADGSVVYANGASIAPNADITLYAKWTSAVSLSTAVDNPSLTFTTGGSADWEATTDESYAGGSSAKSGAISDSQTTWMQTEVSGEGTLSFWYKVSSESGWDKLIFYIDGVQMDAKSGTDGWAQLEYTLTNNTQHVFKWFYSKDGSVSSGSDCCWIDKVEWTPSNPLASTRYDLRTLGRVTSVKSCGSYNTCWAFDALGSLESTLLSETGTSYDFSENNMVNLAGFDWGFDDGGSATIAQAYLLRWDGPALESQDSYPSIGTSAKSSPAVHVQNIIYIPSKTSALDNSRIKRAIVEDGALYASFRWEGSPTSTTSYYNPSSHAYYYNSTGSATFTGLIVGWDDTYSKSNFSTQPEGDGAYIVKTCWGTSFGESGYVYVSYYDATMAYSTMYVFKGEPTSNYVRNYQYDPLGMVSSIGYNKSVAHGANMFTAVESESIAAAGVYVLGANATCTIKVYAGCTTGDPVSGTLKSTKTVSFADAGFYTVPLDEEVPVAAGQLFSIVVGMSVPGYNYPIAYEYAYSGYTSAATAESGQSFISADGATWTDLTSFHATANFCCKAYAKGLAGVTVTLDRQGGSGGTASVTATYGKAMPSITVPTRSGYAFGGYYTSTGGSGTQYYTASGASARTWDKTSATTLYAKWTSNVPSAPTGVSLELSGTVPAVIGGGTITSSGFFLSWNAVAGATEYEVWYNTTSSTSTASQLTQGIFSSDTSYRWTSGYWRDQTYYFWVKAKNASGTSGFSSRVSGKL